jgi:hypothetical protein
VSGVLSFGFQFLLDISSTHFDEINEAIMSRYRFEREYAEKQNKSWLLSLLLLFAMVLSIPYEIQR